MKNKCGVSVWNFCWGGWTLRRVASNKRVSEACPTPLSTKSFPVERTKKIPAVLPGFFMRKWD
jgi:hypothetical protein